MTFTKRHDAEDVKEHGFLFKAEMILALLDGRKTMTRRVCTPHNSLIDGSGKGIRAHWPHLQWDRAWVDKGPSPAGNQGPYWHVPCQRPGYCDDVVHRVYPRVFVGDRIWARETWCEVDDTEFGGERWIDYKATPRDGCADAPAGWHGSPGDAEALKWKSPLHMPRWAARLVLPVIRMGAERVQEIRLGDCAAEGAPPTHPDDMVWDSQETFRYLWDSINAKRGHPWENNSPVWVYEWAPVTNGGTDE